MVDVYLFEIEVTYEAANDETPERLQLVTHIPDNMYYAIGFGDGMYDTDMIGWHGAGDNSYVQDYWSSSKSVPAIDDSNDLEWLAYPQKSSVDVSYDYVTFVAWRALDTGDTEQDFLIPLREQFPMVYGLHVFTSEWITHFDRGFFSMEVDETLGNPDFVFIEEVDGFEVDTVALDEEEEDLAVEELPVPPEKDPGLGVEPVEPVETVDTSIDEEKVELTGGQITPTDPTEKESDDEVDVPLGCHREVWDRFRLLTCYDED